MSGQAALTATVDRIMISELDVLELQLRLSNNTDVDQPDFSLLQRDFEVMSTARSSRQNISLINGRQTAEVFTEWNITLRPKKLGRLQIPSIEIGGQRSAPISIQVNRLSKSDQARMTQYVFFETNVDTDKTYVQGQVLYTVKLFYADGVSGDFPIEPDIPNAVITTLEEGRRSQAVIAGKRYYVLEKRYAIFPQRSGTLEIPREAFTGARGRRGLFASRERVNAISKGHRVTVQSQPGSFSGPTWLPAEALSLTERWTQEPPVFRVGEPITRTIEMVVKGLPTSLLPSLEEFVPQLQNVAGAKIYVDPPQEEQTPLEDSILSRRIETIGIVPTREGTLTLPEIRIPWWNTRTDSMDYAIIPAASFQVAPDPNTAASAAPIQSAAEPVLINSDPQIIYQEADPLWRYAGIISTVLASLLFILWVITWRKLQAVSAQLSLPPQPREIDPRQRQQSAGSYYQALTNACKQGDSNLAHRALFNWVKALHPDIRSLQEFEAKTASDTFSAALADLEKSLFAPGQQQPWSGRSLMEAVAQLEVGKEKRQTKSQLEPLNPN